jgi:hypothetical protein
VVPGGRVTTRCIVIEANGTGARSSRKVAKAAKLVLWSDEHECLRARRRAAAEEALERPWPYIVLVGITGEHRGVSETARQASELAELGACLVDALDQFIAKLSEHDRVEERELAELRATAAKKMGGRARLDALFPPPERRRDAEQIHALKRAREIAWVRTSFARLSSSGTSKLRKTGRPADPGRVRAAQIATFYSSQESITGLTGNGEASAWMPTARDLALLAICEGATELPTSWRTMNASNLIAHEARAMRPAVRDLEGQGKK